MRLVAEDGTETEHYPYVIDSTVLADNKYELKPGQAVELQTNPIRFGSKTDTSTTYPVIACKPGRYSLKYDVKIPSNSFPDRGEWRGTVTTGLRPVVITAPPEETAPEEPEPPETSGSSDANDALDPLELTDSPWRRIRIPLPQP